MGIRRGRPQGPKKEQINIRLLPEYSTLLKNPSPLYWWMRKNNIRVQDIKKQGKAPAHNPSSVISRMLNDTMIRIIDEDPEAFFDYCSRMEEKGHLTHSRWVEIAFRRKQREDFQYNRG
jgi:hypothetical protein